MRFTAKFFPAREPDVTVVDGNVLEIVGTSRRYPHLEVRTLARDSSGEVFVLKDTHKGLVDVSPAERGLPEYVPIVPQVRSIQFHTAGR